MSNMRIYKYPVKITDEFEIEMPKGAHILDVQMQREDACLWAMVDIEAEKETRCFRIIGTGNPIPEFSNWSRMKYRRGYEYIGTFQQHNGALVWHLLEM